MDRRQRALDRPADEGARRGRHPELRRVSRGQTGMAHARVQRRTQQQHLDPARDAGRRREPGRPPHRRQPERARQRERAQVPENRGQHDADDRVAQRRPRVAQRVVGGRVQPSERRRKQADGRSREDPPHVDRVGAAEAPGLKQRRDDNVAERQKRHRRRDDEVRDAAESGVEPQTHRLERRRVGARHGRHRRQFRRRHRHAEEAHRERVERRRVLQSRDSARPEEARDERVDVRAELHDAAADEHRQKVPADRAHVLGSGVQRQPHIRRDTKDDGQLHDELQRGADNRSPGEDQREPRKRRAGAEREERGNHRDVPDNAARVGEQEAPVAVQDAEAPGRHGKEPGAGKQHAHDPDRQLALVAVEPGRDRGDQQRRRHDADEHEHRDDQREQRRHRAGHAIRLAPIAAREQRGVHRNERSRQRAFAEQVLQKIRDAERRRERIGGIVAEAEIVREDALADQPGDPTEEDSGGDEKSPAGSRTLG